MAAPQARPVAVTFDFWNTLLSDDGMSTSRRVDASAQVIAEAGIVVEPGRIADAYARCWKLYQRHWHDNLHFGPADAVEFVLAELDFDGAAADTVRAALVEVIVNPRGGHVPTMAPNIGACLVALQEAGIRIGIICDVGLTPSSTLRRYLESHGLLGHFSHWSFSDEVGVFKPDPVIFRHALAGLGVDDPADAVHIGDLRRTDVAGANAMGITSIRYTGLSDDPPGDPPIEATHVINDHADLPALLLP